MTQLCDWQIRELCRQLAEPTGIHVGGRPEVSRDEPAIVPFDIQQLQPASYDLRLGPEVRSENGLAWNISPEHGEDMEPGRFLLGHTAERITVPDHMCARVEGKSTLARMGLQIHSAGFIDPGFSGQLTLELVNHANLRHFKLRPGMLIAQLSFHVLAGKPARVYGGDGVGSRYQGQLGATPAAKAAPTDSMS